MSASQTGNGHELLEGVTHADILVAIPSLNNADTIGDAAKTIQAGLATYFAGKKTVLLNVDAGSSDNTTDIVKKAAVDDHRHPLLSYTVGRETGVEGPAPKGKILEIIFSAAKTLNASACVLVDPGITSVTPEWLDLLLSPVTGDGYDYVAPLYRRKRYEGGITERILYPVSRALYGKKIRQPIGGNFGISGALAGRLLESGIGAAHHTGYGADLWITTTAAAGRFKICETFLGERTYGEKRGSEELSQTIYHAAGAMFDLMEKYAPEWRGIKGTEAVPCLAPDEPQCDGATRADTDTMIERFRLGVKELVGFWKGFLSREAIEFLQKSAALPRNKFFFADEMWAEIIFSFALAYHHRTDNREHILKSLTPLYLGRTAAFILETLDRDVGECEQKTEALCRAFEKKKFFLLVNWR